MNFKVSKTVVINFGSGNLSQGFPQITVRLWTDQALQAEQVVGSLPAAPELVEFYRIWQSTYRALCGRLVLRLPPSEAIEDELEIDTGEITQVSQQDFETFSQQLRQQINTWLKSDGFLHIDQQVRSRLSPADEIRLIFEVNDDLLRRLPWNSWDFLQDYPKAEMALSRPEYKRRKIRRDQGSRKKVRILAVLGDCRGIDAELERQALQNLADAEIRLLMAPTRQEFNDQLWDASGWDMLFFAGHSQTEGETGHLHINENPVNHSLTIDQLEAALSIAIENGLRLAIFNSCDGIGLAQALGKLQIPQVIVMREPVPNRVAQAFLHCFLEAFAIRQLPLYLATRQAREKLQGLEDEFPGASWLPVICQNPAVEPLNWLQLGGTPPCPYRGLFAFQEADAHLFFGRQQFTNNLVAAVARKAFVAVVGPSGSGKSSVVFAGLVPHLRNKAGTTHCQMISFRPGVKPFDALAEALLEASSQENRTACLEPTQSSQNDDPQFRLNVLELAVELQHTPQTLCQIIARLYRENPGTRLLLIVDQFEELYTLCSEVDRQPFLDELLNTVQLAPPFTLLLTLRADFYGYALSDRRLSDALQGAVYNLGPMSQEELQAAIIQPAAQMQVRLEPGLTDKLIQATWGQAGRLPLLEFALTELWSQQQVGWLTHQAYAAIGGVEEALANHADQVYAQLHPIDQQRVQRIFVQLVEPGVGTDASRRLATRDEVGEANWNLVSHLASSRLVVTNRNETTGEETVEIVHEALISSWGRLEHWLQMDREFRRWQEDLRRARRQWEKSDHEDEALLRGKRLADAKEWYDRCQDKLSSGDRQFIQRNLVVQEREGQQRRRRRQLIFSSLIAGLLVALVLAGVAWWGWQNAAISEVRALSTSSNALFVSNNQIDALTEAIRSQKKLHMIGGVDTETKTQVDSVLRQAVYGTTEYNRLSWHHDEVKSVVFSPNGNTIASASSDKTIKLWKRDGTLIATLNGHTDKIWQAVFSPDGLTIASASKDKTIKLWRIEASKKPILLTSLVGHHHDVRGVAFSPDGQLLASASDDKTVKLWKRDGTLIATLAGHTDIVNGVAFSPDGQLLASTSWDKTIKLWRLETGKMPTQLKSLTGHSDVVFGVTFSPDSQTLASCSWDNTVKLWKRDGSLIETLSGHSDRVWGVAFSPDGQTLTSASGDKTVKFWKLKSPLLTRLTGHTNVVIGVAFSPDGQTIASASDDRTIKLWKRNGTPIATLSGHNAQVYEVTFSPDGQTVASVSADNTVKLWNVGQSTPRLFATLKGHQGVIWGVAFSPDGQMVASASWDNTVKLWNVGQKTPQLFTTLRGHDAAVFGVAFSPDSKTIASTSADNTVKLWRVKPAQMPVLLKTFRGHAAQVYSVAFSPDGQTIASSSADNTIKLWKPDGTLLTTLTGHSAVAYSVAFSPDGQTIASASWDKTIKLWKLDGTLLTTLNGYSGRFWGITFSPNGQTIAAANEDKSVILWNKEQVLTLNPLKYGCNWVHDYLRTNPNVSERDRHLCDSDL